MAVPARWRSLLDGGPCSMAVPARWRSLLDGGPCSMAVPARWRSLLDGGPCSMAVPAMSTRPRTSALQMASTHPAIRNANYK